MIDTLPPELAAKLRATLGADELAVLGLSPPPSSSSRYSLGDGAAPLPAKLRGYHAKPLAAYAATYNRSERTIKRWNSAGRAVRPRPDLPPLDESGAMAAWFRRLFPKEPVPQELLDYEFSAPKNPPPAQEALPAVPAANSQPDPASSKAASAAANVSNGDAGLDAPPPNRMSVSINLSELSLEEGELVQQMRGIVKGNYAQVDAALKTRDEGSYQRWFPIYTESAKALRQLEKELREASKASGSMLPRAQIITELSQMLEMLRLMREAMPQKIVAELGKRAEGRRRRVLKLIEPDLIEAVQTVRSREGDLLMTVEIFRSPSEARDAFTLEAA